MPTTIAATFCATLVDEWVRAGVTHAVVAPGSRSSPLALALVADGRLKVQVHLDERSASFLALGIGLASGRPAVLVCSSGTAAAELHAAVIEAHQAEVPMLVCTADRPPELYDVGAPQTIDQVHIYGPAVRWFHAPGPPEGTLPGTWRSLAGHAYAAATGRPKGPAHLNLSFREPLAGEAGPLPPPRDDGAPRHQLLTGSTVLAPDQLALVAGLLEDQRGVIVAGAGAGDPDAVHALAEAAGWPVLADPRSGCRVPAAGTIAAFDALLRHPEFAAAHRPTVVLRLGQAPASKVLAEWLDRSEARQVQVHAAGTWLDPGGTAAAVVAADPSELCRALADRVTGARHTPWVKRWAAAEAKGQAAISRALAAYDEPTEPQIARDVVDAVPEGGALVASSSMPVRDVEWFSRPRQGLRVLANRGANGIDGVVSTAVGVAVATRAPTALLIGDVAFLHDANGLLGVADRGIHLTIVVVDNDGGGIFSFLPQATEVPPEQFELLFGTPHGVDPLVLGLAHRVPGVEVKAAADVAPAVAGSLAEGGVRLVRVRTERAANVEVHAAVNRAVTAAL